MKNIQTIHERKIKGISGSTVASRKGELHLTLPKNKMLKLRNTLILDQSKDFGIISFEKLTNNGYDISFKDSNIKINRNQATIFSAAKNKNNLYHLKFKMETNSHCFSTNLTFPWHRFFGHPNDNTRRNTIKYYKIKNANLEQPYLCENCSRAKVTKNAIGKEMLTLPDTPFERLYCDTVAMPTAGTSGEKGFLLITDSYSKYKVLKNYKKKKEIPHILIGIIKYLASISEYSIKCAFMGKGTEFVNEEVSNYLLNNKIKSRFSATNTLQLNGTAERANRSVLTLVRVLLLDAKLMQKYWIHAAKRAVYSLNIIPIFRIGVSPYELIHGEKKIFKTKIFSDK
eukprot:snap_masked-scaffold_7-processed-gene-16.30-mRNA-1 protein AED:1.00 eAED:1.00 QI:0/-1/0/0/-1/1/1/0/341